MKLTKTKLRNIIREEISKNQVLSEDIESALQGKSLSVSGRELQALAERLSTHMDKSDAKSIILMWAGEVMRS